MLKITQYKHLLLQYMTIHELSMSNTQKSSGCIPNRALRSFKSVNFLQYGDTAILNDIIGVLSIQKHQQQSYDILRKETVSPNCFRPNFDESNRSKVIIAKSSESEHGNNRWDDLRLGQVLTVQDTKKPCKSFERHSQRRWEIQLVNPLTITQAKSSRKS